MKVLVSLCMEALAEVWVLVRQVSVQVMLVECYPFLLYPLVCMGSVCLILLLHAWSYNKALGMYLPVWMLGVHADVHLE